MHSPYVNALFSGILCIPFLCSKAVCPSGCANGGTCTRPRVCSCQSGWTGATCSQRMLVFNLNFQWLDEYMTFQLFAIQVVRTVERAHRPIRVHARMDGMETHAIMVILIYTK